MVFLEREFRAENYAVDLATDATRSEVARAASVHYDAAILIFNLRTTRRPRDFCAAFAPRRNNFPFWFWRAAAAPKIACEVLDLGADDLVFKPFAFSELSARVRALLRRGGHYAETVLRVEDLELSRMERSVKRAGRKIKLTPKEFALLEYLMRNSGQRVTRTEIIQHVWNLPFDTMTNVVDVYINYLRKKVDAPCEHKLIHTVRGVGYRLQAQNARGGSAA